MRARPRRNPPAARRRFGDVLVDLGLLQSDVVEQAADVFQKLYQCYMDTDASLVEINPLNCDSKGNIIALDSKFNFDSNAGDGGIPRHHGR